MPQAFRDGFRAAVPFATAGGLVGVSFGVVAVDAGLPTVATIAMSILMFAGSAQFAMIAIFGAGGSIGAALVAGGLMNSRFLPMGAAFAPSLPGGPLKRALQGQAVVDASWALAAREDGSFNRWLLFGATSLQYMTWQLGTILGALGGDVLGDPRDLGLDAIYPAFFVALLINEVKSRRALGVALLGGVIALALVPVAPAGIPVLVASLAALVGLSRSAQAAVLEAQEAEGAAR